MCEEMKEGKESETSPLNQRIPVRTCIFPVGVVGLLLVVDTVGLK